LIRINFEEYGLKISSKWAARLLPLWALSGFILGFTLELRPSLVMSLLMGFGLLASGITFRRNLKVHAFLILGFTTMIWSMSWTRTAILEQEQAMPSADILGRPLLISALAGHTFHTDFGYGTEMTRLKVISPANVNINIKRIKIYYPAMKAQIFPPGKRAVFWATVKEKYAPQTVPGVFQNWLKRYARRFSGTIKDLRLVKTPMITRNEYPFLSAGNRELVSFFTHGIPAWLWSRRLADFGVGHLLSVSGLHCGIFYFLLRLFLIFLRKPIPRHIITVTGLIGFAAWMGWSHSVLRAASMLIIWDVLPLFNIQRKWLTIWWAVLLTLLTLNPEALLSKGMWYTFAASLGLIAGYHHPLSSGLPIIEHPWLTRIRWALPLISAQICVIPVNLLFSGSSRPMSVFWNMAGLLFLAVLLGLFLLSILALCWHSLAFIPNYWDVHIQYLLESFRHHTHYFAIYRFPAHPLFVWFILCVFIMLLFYFRSEMRWYACLGVLGFFLIFNRPHRGNHLTMFDTGQGQSILLTTAEGEGALFDCGGKVPFPFTLNTVCHLYGADNLQYVFISHANQDHYELLSQIEGGFALTIPEGQYRDFQIRLPEFPDAVNELRKGDELIFGEGSNAWRIQTLWPDTHHLDGLDLNDRGLVLLFSGLNGQILFVGDAGKKVEAQLNLENIRSQPLILQAGHHGSRTSSSLMFLRKIRPALALISAGRHNPFGHPHPEILDRYTALHIPTMCTRDVGTIEIHLDSKDWHGRQKLRGIAGTN